MSTMNIPLPDSLKTFVDDQVRQGGYGSPMEYVHDLIRKDRECQLRQPMREPLSSPATLARAAPPDIAYFEALRERFLKTASFDTLKGAKDPHGA